MGRNRYQNALNIYSCLESETTVGAYTPSEYAKARKIIYELVEKTIPKKILKSVDENGEPCLPRNHGVCPICGFVVEYSDKHCHECGQRLE